MLAYLLAGLPAARPGSRPEITPQAFLEACSGFVTPARARDLAQVLRLPAPPNAAGASDWSGAAVGEQPHDAATRAWLDLEAQVDDAVDRARAQRTKRAVRSVRRALGGYRVDVVQAVDAAFALPHPGVRERALDALRWRLADELAAAEPDAFAALLARAVQLRLAWRRALWDADIGWAALEASMREIEARGG
jgi:hypothetical protein